MFDQRTVTLPRHPVMTSEGLDTDEGACRFPVGLVTYFELSNMTAVKMRCD
jgi:hypothetical protein